MTTKEHPHAEVLRAIADGVPVNEFEICVSGNNWESLPGYSAWLFFPTDWKTRRKPQYIMVNGFKVPKPLDVMPGSFKKIWFPDLSFENFAAYSDCQDSFATRAMKRGIAHDTEAAASAHAKAMLGIDPEYFK